MKSDEIILEQTPSLHKWLGQRLSKKGITQRQLATSVSRSTSQVNHWMSGKEAFPPALFLLAVTNFIHEEFGAAENLLHVHDITKLLPREASRIVSKGGNVAALATAKIIGKRAEESAAHCDSGECSTMYQFLFQNISAGLNVLNMMKACVEEDKPFIHGSNIKLHLRFPHNVMASDLIKFGTKSPEIMEESCSKILGSMRQTLKNRQDGKYSDHVRQHAFHMLARGGDASDRALVFEITKSGKDLATKRTALYAQIINNPNPQAAEEFIFELERNPALAAKTLEFDLVHYGDKGLDDPSPLKSIENIIVHNLRHIQTHQSAATAQIALHKLLSLLYEFGGKQFDRRRIYPRIRKILERFQEMDYSRLTGVEKRFLNQFGILQDNSTPVLGIINSDSNQLAFDFP